MGPLDTYRARIERGELARDAAQQKMVAALQRLYVDLVRAGEPPRGWRRGVAKMFGQRAAPKRGLYLWGGVGRGKTLMMDLFFGALPFDDKI
ncbi:MAG TPA: AFG1/ZapE family ATPase, partial [Gammaproteobacteria bacterium]|nr:AFG1/ZapE family ATPase [Gammaproteobacteria bacterium]